MSTDVIPIIQHQYTLLSSLLSRNAWRWAGGGCLHARSSSSQQLNTGAAGPGHWSPPPARTQHLQHPAPCPADLPFLGSLVIEVEGVLRGAGGGGPGGVAGGVAEEAPLPVPAVAAADGLGHAAGPDTGQPRHHSHTPPPLLAADLGNNAL